jgi:DNA repair protein RecO (recombination protein O)
LFNLYYSPIKSILNDYQKLVYTSFIQELTDILIRSEQKDEKIFQLLYDNLTFLNNEKNGFDVISYTYVFKLFSELGMTPELFSCVKCRSDLNNDLEKKFSLSDGGVVCSSCFSKVGNNYVYPMSDNLLIFLKDLLNSEDSIPNLNNENRILKEFIHIIKSYLNYNVDQNIKSAKLIS